MKRVSELHRQAMECAEKADLSRIRGDADVVHPLLEKAFTLEMKAALLCADHLEPTRSVLYRSAASLALQCERFRDAEQLVAAGLAGNPPEEIANELRELMQQIRRDRRSAGANKRPRAIS